MTISEEDYGILMEAVQQGYPPTMACGLIGLTPAEFSQLVQSDEDLRKRLVRWDAQGKFGIFATLRTQAELGNVTAGRFLLERVAPEHFGPPKQVMEHRQISVDLNKPLAEPVVTFDLKRLTKEDLKTLQDLQNKGAIVDAEIIE